VACGGDFVDTALTSATHSTYILGLAEWPVGNYKHNAIPDVIYCQKPLNALVMLVHNAKGSHIMVIGCV